MKNLIDQIKNPSKRYCGNVDCTVDKPAENFSPKVRYFSERCQKNVWKTIFCKEKIFALKKLSGHMEFIFDNPAEKC